MTVSVSVSPRSPVKSMLKVQLYVPNGAIVWPVKQLVARMSPATDVMSLWRSSVSESSVTASKSLSLVTTTSKANVPPGSARMSGDGVLVTLMTGSTLVRITAARAVAVALLPSLSLTVAVRMFGYGESNAVPVTGPTKVQA